MKTLRVKKDQIFNLMDTNGRRNDVIDALRGYLAILDDILRKQKLTWDALPKSTAEFDFYRQAIALSPEVFQKHDKYDALTAQLDEMPKLKQAIAERDLYWLSEHYEQIPKAWRGGLDESIEARARHYTNNLVKLGFSDEGRRITAVGDVLLGNIPLHRDRIEALLPLNNTNIVYLRQLLKLRIFDSGGRNYYSPFCMALYALLRKERISKDVFRTIVQGVSPYHNIADYDMFVDMCERSGTIEGDFSRKTEEINLFTDDADEIDDFDEIMEWTDFESLFFNRKSEKAVSVYYHFYQALADFIQTESAESLDNLLSFYENHRDMLNKAFGNGNALFQTRRGDRPAVKDFLENEKNDLYKESLENFRAAGWRGVNAALYRRFEQSKMMDGIREYADTTMRIFKATGLISFDNGYAELVCRDLCQCIFDREVIKSRIMGDLSIENARSSLDYPYDYDYDCRCFYQNQSVSEILSYSNQRIGDILKAVQIEFDGAALAEIPRIVQRRRKRDFETMIASRYPAHRVKYLLGLFADRSKDKIIKAEVCPDATVPTIYEYVVGLAWYYFSNKTIDLLQSFNLTLSADFEPLTHASGGMGDIVIYEPDKVIMLEATLMNAGSQKRGEWEPVLRHSVNLKIEEESANQRKESNAQREENIDQREVTTFFIADSFDANTVNIWKAVSAVPLQSSTDRSRYTDGVIIMPVTSQELARLMDRGDEYNQIIRRLRGLFLKDMESFRQNFNLNWREDFISQL